MKEQQQQITELKKEWESDARWKNIKRDYSAEAVVKLRPSVLVEHTYARKGAERLWKQVNQPGYVGALGTLTGAQAVQMVKGGMQAIYLSGWQVAADMNLSGQTYPDQSLYPSNSVPAVVKRLNQALARADQIAAVDGRRDVDWYIPIVADAEAGFGGALHGFELMKAMIEAGAAGVHFEDQLASEKKCGHLGGKVLLPTSSAIRQLTSARLAADVLGVPTVLIARTDAQSATYLMSDVDPLDAKYMTGKRTPEGYYGLKNGMEITVDRGLAYAPYADLLWFETSKPDLGEAKEFAAEIHRKFPGKLLAYNCSPSFNWSKKLDEKTIARFSEELGNMGFKFQFITLAGWHLINYHTFDLARDYSTRGMPAYVELQNKEFGSEERGYTATRHQAEVGTGYFDEVLMTVTGGKGSTSALAGSTETEQFSHDH